MSTFKVKNLSITLGETARDQPDLGQQQFCLFPTHGCPTLTIHCLHPTLHCQALTIHCRFPTQINCWTQTIHCFTRTCGFYSPCGFFSDPCGIISGGGCGIAHSTLPPTTFETITPVIKTVQDRGVIDQLRKQLEETMEAVKERGVELERGSGPQTKEEAEMLEKELSSALDEVRKMKKNLK